MICNPCCSVGLWNAFYVILYAIGNATKLMRYSTRSNTSKRNRDTRYHSVYLEGC